MKKSLLVLFVLVLSSCSGSGKETPENPVKPTIPGGSTGNHAADEAISDALDQLGSTENMQLWRLSTKTVEKNLTMYETDDLYKNADTIKTVSTTVNNGTSESVVWNNELNYADVSEGTFITKSSKNLVIQTPINRNTITDLKGYDILYTYTPTIQKVKRSIKGGGETDEWETVPDNALVVRYFLIKETDTKLYHIPVDKFPNSEDKYSLIGSHPIDDKFATIYNKK